MKTFLLLAVLSTAFAEFTTGDEISTDYTNFLKKVYAILGINENYDDLLRCLNNNNEILWKELNEEIQSLDLKNLEEATYGLLCLTTETIEITKTVIPCAKDPNVLVNIVLKMMELYKNPNKFVEKVSKNLGRIGKEIGDYVKAWKTMNTIECGRINGNLIKWFFF